MKRRTVDLHRRVVVALFGVSSVVAVGVIALSQLPNVQATQPSALTGSVTTSASQPSGAGALAAPTATYVPEGSVIDLDPEEVYEMADPKRPPFVLTLSPEMGTVTLPTGWDMGYSVGMAVEDGKVVPYSAFDFQYKGAVILVNTGKQKVESLTVPEGLSTITRASIDQFVIDIMDGK